MSINPVIQEIIEYLESNDLEVVNHFKNTVQEKLYSSKDPSLLDVLICRYIQTKSERLLELLITINDSNAMYLFEKLNDHLKHGARLEVCTLLFSIVRKQPSWLHKLAGTPLFATFLKYLKSDGDYTFIMSGLIILCTLLPCVPIIISTHHGDILEVFVRTSSMLLNTSVSIPEVCLLHLHVSVYILFHRLYSMYPNNFLSYLRSCFGGSKKDPVFQQIIKPMFEFVKFHPDLVTETPKSETGVEKWKIFQPHDVLVECQRVSLDPVDFIKENRHSITQAKDTRENPMWTLNSTFSYPQISTYTSPYKNIHEITSTENRSLYLDPESLCNPSEICEMNTPPTSRPISPSSSGQNLHSLSSKTVPEQTNSGSNQTLNELNSETKHSGQSETASIKSYHSPETKRREVKKTKSFGSLDNVTSKNIMKSWLPGSATHSTPADKEVTYSQKSAPTTSSRQSQTNRPKSTEFFKHSIAKHLSLGSSDVQSAPVSPMLHTNTSATQSQFSFNLTDDYDPDLSVDGKKRNSYTTQTADTSKQFSHTPLHKTSHSFNAVPPNQLPTLLDSSAPLFRSISTMFAELCPKPYKDGNDTGDGSEQSHQGGCQHVHKSKSPLSLLDDFIQYGSDIHSYRLSRIPLTSQLDTDWTYYGGNSPVDEIKLLQKQVLLIHTQLLYERYKCELHCLRNRRLFGTLQQTQASQHEMILLKKQISFNEKKFNDLKSAIRIRTDENRKLQQQASTKELVFSSKIRELESQINKLEFKLRNTKMKKKEVKKELSKSQKEVHKAKHLLHETMHEVLNLQQKLKNIDKLQAKNDALEKNLIIQSEKQEQIKNRITDFASLNLKNDNLKLRLDASKREIDALQQENDNIQTNTEHFKVRLSQLEAANAKKNHTIDELKHDITKLKDKHQKNMQVLEERFQSSQKNCQSLNSYIVHLYSKLEDIKHGISASTSSHSSSQHSLSRNNLDKVRKSASYAGLDTLHKTHTREARHHDNSHRHQLSNTPARNHEENPFKIRSNASSISSVSESLRKQQQLDFLINKDSGVGESSVGLLS